MSYYSSTCLLRLAGFFGSLVLAFPVSLAQSLFVSLGDLPGGNFNSRAYGVSADGSVVVGRSVSANGPEAARWQNGTMTGLGDLPGGNVNMPGGNFNSLAYGVSADGSVVVGYGTSANGIEAARWQNGTMTGLGDLPGRGFLSVAHGVSADGSVVVGYGESANGPEAFRWQNGTMTGLGDLPGGIFRSFAFGVSADGSVVVGRSESANGGEAFRWQNGTMTGLGDLPGGSFNSEASGVSADGSVVVGFGVSANGVEAFRWQDGTMTGLGDLPGGFFDSRAHGVSADGSVVVGMAGASTGGYQAFVWTASYGMLSIADLLVANGADLSGWSLVSANAISASGNVIVGEGIRNGNTEAWAVNMAAVNMAAIPEPSTYAALAGLASLGVALWRRRAGRGTLSA